MATMDWTLCASKIEIEDDGFIDLKQFKAGQIIENAKPETARQSWMIIDVRREWLKVRPLFKQFEGDPRKNVRFNRMSIDINFERGWWRIAMNR